jgi:hypothetical protein
MTLTEFLQKLEATSRAWALVCDPLDTEPIAIRLGQHCPLSAVAGTSPCSIRDSRVALDIDAGLADAIASAADGDEHDPLLRDRLLKACGLR